MVTLRHCTVFCRRQTRCCALITRIAQVSSCFRTRGSTHTSEIHNYFTVLYPRWLGLRAQLYAPDLSRHYLFVHQVIFVHVFHFAGQARKGSNSVGKEEVCELVTVNLNKVQWDQQHQSNSQAQQTVNFDNTASIGMHAFCRALQHTHTHTCTHTHTHTHTQRPIWQHTYPHTA